jgi:hypothetical protein
MAAYNNISVDALCALARCIRRSHRGSELILLRAYTRPRTFMTEQPTQRLPSFR